MPTITGDVAWLRDVILGKIEWRKCPVCAGRGFEYYSGETGEVWGNPLDNEATIQESLGEWCDTDYCENCQGLGYIEIPN